MQIIPHVEQESSPGSENKENLSELGRQTSLGSSVNKYSNESTIPNPKGQSGKFTRCCVINTRGFRPAILEARTNRNENSLVSSFQNIKRAPHTTQEIHTSRSALHPISVNGQLRPRTSETHHEESGWTKFEDMALYQVVQMHVRESAVSNDVQLNWYMITHSFKGLFFPSLKSVTTTEIKDRYKLIHSQYRDYVFNESHSLHTIQRIHREEKLCISKSLEWTNPYSTCWPKFNKEQEYQKGHFLIQRGELLSYYVSIWSSTTPGWNEPTLNTEWNLDLKFTCIMGRNI